MGSSLKTLATTVTTTATTTTFMNWDQKLVIFLNRAMKGVSHVQEGD